MSSNTISTVQTLIESEVKSDFDSSQLTFITPKKSISDERQYRIFTLPNGLECILVSDPHTEKAACSMDVHVGHFSDPKEVKGLAHFLEHMLFLGTKKYPNEAEYDQFIKDHGGSNNAATYSHHTNYDFDVDAIYLKEALDRFAQFFINPLFTETATNRELNAVHSEHCANLQDDDCRIYQFDKLQCLAQHPWFKFDTGNVDTLKHDLIKNNIDLRKHLLKFHKDYYYSNIMKLAIIGKEDLHTLTQIVYNSFNQIKNLNNFKAPIFSRNVFDKSLLPKLYKIIPIKEKRDLQISWVMDPIYYETKKNPVSLISYCIGNEGKGSLLEYLKCKGFATGLSAGIAYNEPEFAIFECVINLSINGLKYYKDVMFIVYQYIFRLKSLSTKQWRLYFEERKKVDGMRFNFKGKEEPYDYVERLSQCLQKDTYLRNDFLHFVADISFEFDVDLIRKYVESLNVVNCYNYIISSDFKDEAKETEEWYGTKYIMCKMDQDLIQKCLNIKDNDIMKELYAPLKNKYIAEDMSVFDDDNKENKENEPKIIESNEKCVIYFKKDNVFKKPKLCFSIKIQCPYLDETVLSQNLTNLFFLIFNDELSTETYDFTESDLSFKAKYYGQNVMYFEFNGYNDKLHVLAETVLNKFADFKFCKEKFEINKEKLRQNLLSKLKLESYRQNGMIGGYLYYKKTHSIFELIDNVSSSDDITFENVENQYNKIINGKLFVEALIFGNCTLNTANTKFISLINEYLLKNTKGIYSQQQLMEERHNYCCLKFENKDYYLRFKSMNEKDINSSVGNDYFFVSDSLNVSDFAKLKLFSWIIDAPFFDELRTKQQLGYIVWSFESFNKGMLSFRTVIQSPSKDPIYLDEQIEIFLKHFREKLVSMNTETFKLNKESVINDLLEKTKTIKEQHSRYWNEIWTQRMQFNRFQNVAKAIQGLENKDIVQFYDKYILNKSGIRCKVSTQCFAHNHTQNFNVIHNENQRENIILHIDDIKKIKFNLECHTFPY